MKSTTSLQIFMFSVVSMVSASSELEEKLTFTSRYLPDTTITDIPKYIKKVVSEDKVVMFTTNGGYFGILVQKWLKKFGIKAKCINLDRFENSEAFRTVLAEKTGSHILPRLFVYGKFVGGYEEIKKLYYSGHLKKILRVKD